MDNHSFFQDRINQYTRLIEIATRDIYFFRPDQHLNEAARLMAEQQISAIVIGEAQTQNIRILTQYDISQASQSEMTANGLLGHINTTPVLSVPENMTCLDAYQLILHLGIHHLAIVSDNKTLLGFITATDFNKHINHYSFPAGQQLIVDLIDSYRQNKDQQETALRTLLENIPDSISRHDTQCRCIYANTALQNCIGKPLENLLGYTPLEYLGGSTSIADYQEKIKQVLTTGQPETLFLEWQNISGDFFLSEMRLIPETDVTGKITSILCIGQDVTSQKQAINALERECAKNVALLQNASDGIHIVDLNGYIIEVSDAFCTMLGYQRQEMMGMHISQWNADFSHQKIQSRFSQLSKLPSRTQFETRHIRKDGSVFDVEISACKLELDSKPMLFYSSRDITERKHAEQYEQFRSHILEMLSYGKSLEIILNAIIRGVEQLYPDMLCSILLLDATGEYFSEVFAPSLPDSYNNAIKGLKIGIGVGSCGTAAASGERVIVEDIATHPYWANYVQIARQTNLGACWSQPIRSSTWQILGTFAIYHQLACCPNKTELLLIEQLAHLVSIAIERMQAEEKLYLAASVFTHAREGIMITELDGTIIEINAAFTCITGYSRSEALGNKPSMLSSGRHNKEFYTDFWKHLIVNNHWFGEIWNRRKNGEIYPQMLTISAVADTQQQAKHYVALFSDITAYKEHEQQLEHIAHYDALTNLPNRLLLADRLQQGIIQAQRHQQLLAVIYLDLDGFKGINDKYGHDVGDLVLLETANRMRASLRDSDTLARLGGDEFVVVMLDISDLNSSIPMFNRLITAVDQPLFIGELSLHITASLGVAFYPQTDDVDADHLLRQADQAMYQAKLTGKNRYHLFDSKQDSNIRGHHESIAHIRQALKDKQFVLYYQPKANMRTGKIIGAEALIRWQHPERGLLAPGIFLPVIENHPLAIELGEWVIDQALTQMEIWKFTGLQMAVSVNIGAEQLQHPRFVDRLREILAKHATIPPKYLELEVLETSALEDITHVSHIIATCQSLGVSFALDDFGTGYSSLTYLKRLPVSMLKIDQSFVRDMLDDPDDLSILEGVIGLSSAFHRQIIAEGVETVEHGELLLQIGCELGQGYGIARPMPAEQLPHWVSTWVPYSSWQDLFELRRENLPLLFASIELRAWFLHLENYFNAQIPINHHRDNHQYRFGNWLSDYGNVHYGTDENFQLITRLYQQILNLGKSLYDLHTAGQTVDTLKGIQELYQLRLTLNQHIKLLIKANLN
ncbi:EAL domain-containing protein [Methylomonas sp. AM2-LC]|uniref:EAL domain-containing protein n=1 Tax=Methylomonas sp. AM2-LC TaxID=3153301 RepID=UPI0032670BE6